MTYAVKRRRHITLAFSMLTIMSSFVGMLTIIMSSFVVVGMLTMSPFVVVIVATWARVRNNRIRNVFAGPFEEEVEHIDTVRIQHHHVRCAKKPPPESWIV